MEINPESFKGQPLHHFSGLAQYFVAYARAWPDLSFCNFLQHFLRFDANSKHEESVEASQGHDPIHEAGQTGAPTEMRNTVTQQLNLAREYRC